MTATLDAQGRLVLPPEIDLVARAHPARSYDVMISTSGVIMLRPDQKPQRGLVESFAALQGLEIVRRRDPIPAPPEL